MSLFNPVDVMGPAHRGAQVQHLAQTAAQNVMRRQKMRSLLARGASGAAQAGAGQQIHSSQRMHPTALHGLALRNPGAVGVPGLFGGPSPGARDDGSYGAGGGGYDYPSLPTPNDPMQSAASTMPDAVSQVPGYNPNLAPTPVGTASDGTPLINNNPNATNDAIQPHDAGGNAPIHLGGGLYYDPITDSVRGGPPR